MIAKPLTRAAHEKFSKIWNKLRDDGKIVSVDDPEVYVEFYRDNEIAHFEACVWSERLTGLGLFKAFDKLFLIGVLPCGSIIPFFKVADFYKLQ